jgi:hypothetical protein
MRSAARHLVLVCSPKLFPSTPSQSDWVALFSFESLSPDSDRAGNFCSNYFSLIDRLRDSRPQDDQTLFFSIHPNILQRTARFFIELVNSRELIGGRIHRLLYIKPQSLSK